jgi:surfactin family lipopeptide synthetase A
MTETLEISERKRKLLEEYLQQRLEAPAGAAQVPRRARTAVVPLTFAQQQVWLHAQLAPNIPVYNEPFTVHRKGALNVAALERSFTEMIRRHEAWRTTFEIVDGQPVQVVHAPFEITLPVVDLRHLAAAERFPAALLLATEEARRPFDLAKLPLVRARLVRLEEEEYRLFINCHHLIFDGVTGYQVFLPELVSLYQAFSDARQSPLPELAFQYGDYAVWQRESLNREALRPRLDYWRRQLGGTLPVLQLPADRPGATAESFRGATQFFSLSRELSEDLRSFSRRQGVTLFMTLLAALDTVLYRCSGQDDILIGSITAGRGDSGTEKLLGFFLNTVVLRTDLTGNPTFAELLDRVRKTTLEALSNDGVPLDEVLKELHVERDRERNPLFRVLLSLEPSLSETEPGWDLTAIDVETGTSKFDLCLVLDDRSDGLSGRLIYSADLFNATTISVLVESWQTILQAAVANPDAHISEMPILPERERHKLLVEFNQTQKSYPLTFVQQRFEREAETRPNDVAVQCGNRVLSYRELDERANKLAHYLRSVGVGPEVLVGLCLERSPEMIVGILGVLKSGGVYVPLDPAYPPDRLKFMINDCEAAVLLTQSHLPVIGSSNTRVVSLDAEWLQIDRESERAPVVDLRAENLAYVIYTSGSAGAPKGVQISHFNLAQSTSARLDYYEGTGKKFLLLSSFAFDSSVASIFHALCSGGTLILPDPEFNWQGRQVGELISHFQVSNILCIPSIYNEVLHEGDTGKLTSLQTVIVAGEPCPRQVVEMHFQALPGVELFNEYGPTEATVWSTVHRCKPRQEQNSVPIGHPVANTQLYVLDRNLQPVPRGVAGELYIAGDGVAHGYLNRPDLAQQMFLPTPFDANAASRMYRTGDVVRYLPNGDLQFLGRADEQVKIRGMRIEPGEIEAILAEHPDVKEAAITAAGERQLVAHVVASEQFATSGAELNSFLKSRLPSHMVPSVFRFVSALPRTPNGKVDRNALVARSESAEEAPPSDAVAPRDDIEARLLKIWSEVLETEISDVTQNFFQLGGHSLLAAKLLYRIEKEFAQPLSLAFVFQAPTVELMADWLRSPDQSLRARAIVEIQPKGSQPPLFWIRGGPRFRLLAQKLGLDQPFLGLDIPFSDAIKLPTPYRIEDIAAFLVKAMREVQPRGPYSLSGLCVNAVIAYEVARQLSLQGEAVCFLAMFDAHNQAYYKNPLKDGRYTGRIKYHLANIIHSDMRQSSAYILDRFQEARRKLERTLWQLSSDQGSNGRAGKMHNADAVVHPAFHRYEPQTYSGKIVLFQSSEWPQGSYFDFALGWKDLAQGGIDSHRIPGNHPSMFTEPHVNLVATTLKDYLSRSGPQERLLEGANSDVA